MNEELNQFLVSINVCTYNSSRYIIETLDSIKNQSYHEKELIITDDSSNDETVKICKIWLEQNQTHFKKSKIIESSINTGIAANLNRGIKECKGHWIILVAGDDALYKDSISSYVNYVKKNKEILISHGVTSKYKNNFNDENFLENSPTKKFKFNQEISTEEQFEIMLRINPIIGGLFINEKVFDKVGYFNEKIPFWEDKPFYLKVLKKGIRIHFFSQRPVYKYRIHSESISRSKNKHIINFWRTERNTVFLENYGKYLKFFERLIFTIENSRKLLMLRLGLSKKTKLNLLINFVSGFLFWKINNYYLRKYR